jgi:hypothetical protein
MDQTDNTGSIFQTLAGALAGGISGYYDSQQTSPVYVTQPTPQTQYGTAGVNQNAGTIAGINPMLLLGGVALVLFLVLRK